jgi:hypothetical protein
LLVWGVIICWRRRSVSWPNWSAEPLVIRGVLASLLGAGLIWAGVHLLLRGM